MVETTVEIDGIEYRADTDEMTLDRGEHEFTERVREGLEDAYRNYLVYDTSLEGADNHMCAVMITHTDGRFDDLQNNLPDDAVLRYWSTETEYENFSIEPDTSRFAIFLDMEDE